MKTKEQIEKELEKCQNDICRNALFITEKELRVKLGYIAALKWVLISQ